MSIETFLPYGLKQIEKLNVGIIYHSGDGQLAYMLALYHELIFGINGFKCYRVNDLDKLYSNLFDYRRWPCGTASEYIRSIPLTYMDAPLFELTYLNYVRGILMEREGDKDLNSLFDFLLDCSNLMFCISAEKVRAAIQGEVESVNGLRRYLHILHKVFQGRSNRTFPVALTITEGDKLEPGEFFEAKSFLSEHVFRPLFDDREDWLVMLTAVALGHNLGIDNNGKIIGTLEPVNVHLPLCFAIYSKIVQKSEEYLTEKDKIVLEATIKEMFEPDPETGNPCAYLYYHGRPLTSAFE